MYRVTIRQKWDGPETMIHSPHANPLKLINTSITQDVATIPGFTFNIYPGNPGYDAMHYMTTLVRVYDTVNKMDVFEGRVLKPSEPIETTGLTYKTIACEGLLAWLHDSRPGFIEFDGKTRKQILTSLVNAHNAQMTALDAPYKCFKLGNINMADTVAAYCYTDDTASTYDNLETLVKQAGYELAVRHESDGLYLDCAKTIGETGNQVIRLGANLISFTRTIDPTALASAYLPLGKAADTTSNDKGTARLTIASANNGNPLLSDADMLKQFGPIVGAKSWDNETNATKLKTTGSSYFKSLPVATISTQVQAIDMSFVGKSKSPLLCGWTYRTLIPTKGIDEPIRISQMTIDINDPRNNTLTIGDRVVGQETYNAQILMEMRKLQSIKSAVKQQGERLISINKAASDALKASITAQQDASEAKANYRSVPDFIAVGDSITYGYKSSNPTINSWPAVIAAENGIRAYNEGVSYSTWQNSDDENKNKISVITRASIIDWTRANLIILFAGTNDFADSLPIGKVTDNTDKTMCGAINQTLDLIYKANPTAEVVFITPMWRARINNNNEDDINTEPNAGGIMMGEYVEAVIAIANKHSLPVMDLFKNSGLNLMNYKNWLTDGLYPNDAGYIRLAHQIKAFLSTI